MIRTAAPRPVRAGIALAGIAGALALAGCGATGATGEPDAPGSDAGSDAGSSAPGDGTYVDGTYSAEGTYATPETVETLSVTVTLEGDVITDVEVVGEPQKAESQKYQGEFIGGISDVVVGQDIDDISVSRVAGSSLSSGGFNAAIETIKVEAAA